MSLQTGQIVDGKYRIIRELGSGSMGAVYEGENVRIKRRVAIKVLLPAVAERGDVVQRFEREAQAAGRIGSDHIVEVLDLGTLANGGFYMVMEFLEGETLGARIKRSGRLEGRLIAPIVQQLLMGLEMAHEAKIIHRDLKPENVFLCREHAGQADFVKILDFGVSKFNPLTADEGMSMTRTGTVVGTPFYMAPEQAKGARDIDSRSDLYSCGVILYEAVTGQVPFHAGTFNELIFKIVLEAPPPPEQYAPDLDPGFARIVRKAMGREPGDRYQTAAEFRDALYVWLHTGRDTARPVERRAPPIGSDVDWAEEKKTLLMDPDDSGNMSTRLLDGPAGMGGGTALIDPLEAQTRVMDDGDDNAKTVTKPSQPPSKRAPPPPRRQGSAPSPVADPSAVSAVAQPVAVEQAPRQSGGLGYGAPTPVNRRPAINIEPWPTGVPRERVATLPIVFGAVLLLAAGGAAAALLLPWSTPAEATVAADSDTSTEDADEDDDAPPPPTIAQDVDIDTDDDIAGSGADTPPPTPVPASAHSAATEAPAPMRPPPTTQPPAPPRASPRPASPRPAPPRPPPAPQPPAPQPPKPKPPGRKIETTL